MRVVPLHVAARTQPTHIQRACVIIMRRLGALCGAAACLAGSGAYQYTAFNRAAHRLMGTSLPARQFGIGPVIRACPRPSTFRIGPVVLALPRAAAVWITMAHGWLAHVGFGSRVRAWLTGRCERRAPIATGMQLSRRLRLFADRTGTIGEHGSLHSCATPWAVPAAPGHYAAPIISQWCGVAT
jgi:hypothetical protein